MDTPELPLEIYHVIAKYSEGVYKALLAVPAFARSIDVSARYDYMILFMHSVVITSHVIVWMRAGVEHKLDGPAVTFTDGYMAWYVNGKLHRTDGPAIHGIDGYSVWYQNDRLH